MAITLQQIAELAGVSRGTVDRAINNRGRINPEVAEKILRIANENGYFASKRRGGVTKKIGIITQLNTSAFMIHIRDGIEKAVKELKERNVDVILKGTDTVNGKEQATIIDEMTAEKIDGLAIMPSDSQIVRDKIRELRRDGIPVVTFNSDLDYSERNFFIGLNNEQSGRAAAGLMGMMTRGIGKVLVITGYFTNDVNIQRVEGFIGEMKKAYPRAELLGVQSSFDRAEEVENIIVTTMTNIPDIDGIFIASGGQEGIQKAFNKVKIKKRPYVIVYDRTPANEKALREGTVDFVIGQEGFRQGYSAPVRLADLLLNNEMPASEYEYTDAIIITKYNI
ncbi:MAG: LacI family DNA-binding transcriptional regulator [Eubacteriaceae bacterium]|nr:LacI family DNA-binding transcriptional regulator [Eubacteriaceae bacterium]